MSKDNRTCAIIGRWQPFHLGHLTLVQFLAEQYERVVVVIGSANRNYEPDNPFTAGERQRMIHESLEEAGVKGVKIRWASDQYDNLKWARSIVRLTHCEVVACARKFHPVFRAFNCDTITTPKWNRSNYRGTYIRTAMMQQAIPDSDPWLALVPPATARIISEIQGIPRILAINEKDV